LSKYSGITVLKKICRLRKRIRQLERENAEFRRTKAALAESEKKYRTIFENTGTATILIDQDTTIAMVNTEFEKISGFARHQLTGKKKWIEFIHKEDLKKMMDYHHKRRETKGSVPKNYTCRVINYKGEIRTALMTVDLIKGTTQSVASVMDITEQKRLEKEILNISERERRKIGQDLHDDLGQHLIGVEALSMLLTKRLEHQDNDEQLLAREISELVSCAISKTRGLAKGLCPVDLDENGLVAALIDLTENVSKIFSKECILDCKPELKIASNTIATNFYHIIQESVNNAIKHGEAERIVIKLLSDDAGLTLRVKDNGKGFNPEGGTKGLGLRIMKFRASGINGILKINSSKGKGTVISCVVN
jgi:PAS domain S-box-containing protein